MTSIQSDPLNKDTSNTKNILISTSNNQSNKNDSTNPSQVPPLNANLNKSNQIPMKDKRINKLNINSYLNMPSSATNRDHNDYFENEVLYQDDEEIEPIFKEYTMINDRRNKALDDLANSTQRVKVNNLKIEELKKNLVDLKEEKKQKHAEIINLLSNKETIEEIYDNNIAILNTNLTNGNANSKNNNSNTSRKNDNKGRPNYSNTSRSRNADNDTVNPDESSFKVSLNEIKESDQKKYVGEVINMFEDLFKKRDEKINSLIAKNIKYAYELFVNNINQENYNEKNNDVIIGNFFGKVSLFISNHSLGRFTENRINLFLRYLLKINAINAKLTKYIKFVTKKYQEKKKELNDMISFLEKKNINLIDKTKRLENNLKEYDDKLEFYGKSDVFEFDKLDNSDDGIIREEKVFRNKRKIVKRNKLKNKDNEEHLSHDVVIEYEDGIDQNAVINYEDDLANEYDYEKENEMIKQGINPYNNDVNKFNSNKNASTNENENTNTTNLSVMVIRNRSKRLNTANEQNQATTQPNNDAAKESDKKLEHYKRVQRIMNSGPKVVGIFGVNNYNPENCMYANKGLFSPNKTENNMPNSSNKINKTIRIGSKDNHNFVSVINKTRMVPIKKKNTDNKTKDKSKKNNNDDTVINVINLEENFLNELKDDDKNEIAGESTNNNSKSNKNNNSNENIENDDNYKSNKPNEEKNNNKNEVQGYFLNIINSKQNENDKNNEKNKDEKLNNENSLNENNEIFKNSGKNVLKVNKNSKVGMLTKKHPKGLIPNNDTRRTKLTINTDNKEVLSSINSTRYKAHNSLSKNINHKKISNNSVTENNYSTINDSLSKRSHSISVNFKNEENNNKYASKVIVSSNISSNETGRKRSIPRSKFNN